MCFQSTKGLWFRNAASYGKKAEETRALYGDWKIDVRVDPLDDFKFVSAKNSAYGQNATFLGMLTVNCVERSDSISILVAWPGEILNPSQVYFSFDKDMPIYANNWVQGQSGPTRVHSPNTIDSDTWLRFLRNVLTKQSLYMQTTGINGDVMGVRYNLDKSKNAINKVFDACGLPKDYVYATYSN